MFQSIWFYETVLRKRSSHNETRSSEKELPKGNCDWNMPTIFPDAPEATYWHTYFEALDLIIYLPLANALNYLIFGK